MQAAAVLGKGDTESIRSTSGNLHTSIIVHLLHQSLAVCVCYLQEEQAM
jgi:hypothetical protein